MSSREYGVVANVLLAVLKKDLAALRRRRREVDSFRDRLERAELLPPRHRRVTLVGRSRGAGLLNP
jgi:hypothetical protein